VGAAQRHQEGVIDVAAAVFPDIRDLALEGELLGCGEKMIQGFASALKSSKFKVQGSKFKEWGAASYKAKPLFIIYEIYE
jgi:hypothetical protein